MVWGGVSQHHRTVHFWDPFDQRVRARAIPPGMSGNLQVPWWKSGVTSDSKNGQIWCSP